MIDLPPDVDPCPTCHAAGCERCYMTGRSHIIRFVFQTSRPGRCIVRVWFGPPGTQQLITDPGIAIDDRRTP
jgi:hypothetical protein